MCLGAFKMPLIEELDPMPEVIDKPKVEERQLDTTVNIGEN